tara:strand:- start:5147 stop:5494 length:348 start_codon:yes stop_codon:yes gene_type:complete
VSQEFVVYFEWDESDLTSEAAAVIDRAVRQIAARGDCSVSTVGIGGHADRSGAAAYNVRLSARRAAVVRDALVARGVSADMISTEAFGETANARPTEDGVREPLNRRSEVRIIVQ